MKIVKGVAYVSFTEFLEVATKDYPALKFGQNCDEYGCDTFLKENKWFGKIVCRFWYHKAEIYKEEYKNDIIRIIRDWEVLSGEEFTVEVP